MNILISSSSFLFSDQEGIGEGILVYEIIKRLLKRGHNITLLAPKSSLLDKDISKLTIDFDIDLFPATSELREEVGWHYFAYKSLEETKAIIKNKRVDIIHHMAPTFLGRYSFLSLLNKPFVYGPVHLEHKDINFEKEFVKNYVPLSPREKEVANALNLISQKQYQRTISASDRIIISLPSVVDSLPRSVRHKCVVIPLGVDTKQFCPKHSANQKRDIVLSVGHMTMIKGFDYLIKSMPDIIKKKPRAKLILIGDGPDRSYFEKLAKDLNLNKNVTFLGPISHKRIHTHFQRCSIYCQPSLSETFGSARLEAMACGKPVVYTSAGAGENGFISNGEYGGMVAPRSSKALSSEILRFINSPLLARKSGKINRELTLKYYDWEAIVTKYENVYKSILCSHKE